MKNIVKKHLRIWLTDYLIKPLKTNTDSCPHLHFQFPSPTPRRNGTTPEPHVMPLEWRQPFAKTTWQTPHRLIHDVILWNIHPLRILPFKEVHWPYWSWSCVTAGPKHPKRTDTFDKLACHFIVKVKMHCGECCRKAFESEFLMLNMMKLPHISPVLLTGYCNSVNPCGRN